MSSGALPRQGGLHRTDAVAQLRALYQISAASNQTGSDDDLLRHTAAAARVALQASSVSIERFEREHGLLRTLVNAGELGPGERELPDDETYVIDDYAALGMVDAAGRGVVSSLDDVDGDPVEQELLRTLGKHSSLDVPIFLDGRVWGELHATRAVDLPPFHDRDLEFAEAVAAQVAAGIAQGAHARRLEALVRIDPLTGIASRSAVEERLERAVDGYLDSGHSATVVICDVNELKQVNDEFGHAAGDRLLTQVAELLGMAAADLPGSLAGRLGSDEFCLVVETVPVDDVVAVASELCRRASRLSAGGGVSCGIASTADPIGHIAASGQLLRLADAAQYRAKRGRLPVPVVAGRLLPPMSPADPAVDADGPLRPGSRQRVARRHRADGAKVAHALLGEVVAELDAVRGESVIDRLSLVGDVVTRALDGVAWWVSVVPGGESALRSLRFGAPRAIEQPGPDAPSFFTLGSSFALSDFPETERAVAGGWFTHSVDDPRGDPAEQDVLREWGFSTVLAAGGGKRDERWLVEVFADEHSRRLPPVGPTLRAAVALALAEAR